MKEARLEIVLSEKDKKSFAKTCKKKDVSMGQVIREFIKTYAKTHK